FIVGALGARRDLGHRSSQFPPSRFEVAREGGRQAEVPDQRLFAIHRTPLGVRMRIKTVSRPRRGAAWCSSMAVRHALSTGTGEIADSEPRSSDSGGTSCLIAVPPAQAERRVPILRLTEHRLAGGTVEIAVEVNS